MTNKLAPMTALARAGVGEDSAFGAVMPPLYLSSAYVLKGFENKGPYDYSRTRNPTRDTLATLITELEGGAATHVVNAGMAALTLVLHLLNPEDLLLAPYDCYGRSYALMAALAKKRHFRVEFVDTYDTAAMIAAFAKVPRMVFIESPSNPLLRIADIPTLVATCKTLPTPPLVVCDNTFVSPLLLKPLHFGADITLCSTTKFLNGHSDVVGGSVTTATQDIWEELDFWSNSLGLAGSAFSCYMTLRGMRTLALRLERAEHNAHVIAQFLAGHDGVDAVHYPGLESHPHHERAKAQQAGFGSMISFTLRGDVGAFIERLQLFSLAQSLGGVESLINHPATMTHVAMGEEARERAGVSRQLVRLSVGIEDVGDLITDLGQAL